MIAIDKKKLQAAMFAKGFGVYQLAEIAGIAPSIASKILSKDGSMVRLPTVSKLSKALNVPAQDLISEET